MCYLFVPSTSYIYKSGKPINNTQYMKRSEPKITKDSNRRFGAAAILSRHVEPCCTKDVFLLVNLFDATDVGHEFDRQTFLCDVQLIELCQQRSTDVEIVILSCRHLPQI
jgi:hypothetical protein